MSGVWSTRNRSPDAISHDGIFAPRVAAEARSRAEAGLPVRVAQPLRATPPPRTIDVRCQRSRHMFRRQCISVRAFIVHRDTRAAEPHIRSPSITADTKIPHARGLRLGNGTNLYDGISQPERCQVRSPISAGSVGAQWIPLRGQTSSGRFHHYPLRQLAVRHVAPKRDQQLSGERNDRDPPRSSAFLADAGTEPEGGASVVS
jgi:hypothetical protein